VPGILLVQGLAVILAVAGARILNPGAQEVLRHGDEILAIGAPGRIRGWLNERPAQGGPAAAPLV
jgi:hypothetical protein